MLMKYVVLKSEDQFGHIHELPIMFPYALVHKEMKECGWRALMESDHRFIECVGAGFCNLDKDSKGDLIVRCHGESESLNIKSRYDADEAAFARCDRGMFGSVTERFKREN